MYVVNFEKETPSFQIIHPHNTHNYAMGTLHRATFVCLNFLRDDGLDIDSAAQHGQFAVRHAFAYFPDDYANICCSIHLWCYICKTGALDNTMRDSITYEIHMTHALGF